MRRFAFLVLLICPRSVVAEAPWVPLSGGEIRAALTDRKLTYGTAWQEFFASGRTLYNAGADSWGYWRVTDDKYCSQWPPNDLWACYAMEQSGDALRFVGNSNDITTAHYLK